MSGLGLPQPIADLVAGYIPSAAMDVVGVYDMDFNQVFKRARPVSLDIREPVRLATQPIEDGSLITDHRILDPNTVDLSLVFKGKDAADTYDTIRQLKNKSTFLIVQTRARNFKQMVITDMAGKEDTSTYGTITMVLKLQQIRVITAETTLIPRNAKNKKTQDRGQIQPTTPKVGPSGLAEGADFFIKPKV